MGVKWYKFTGRRFGSLTVLGSGRSVKTAFGTRKYWSCRCDCGKSCEVVSNALITGKTRSCGCLRVILHKKRCGAKHPGWKGGRHIDNNGYVRVLYYPNPGLKASGYVKEHVLVMQQHIGRKLVRGETVHHKNGLKTDNRLENLELWSSSHPSGQRVTEKVEWCVEFLRQYAAEKLAG